MIVVLAPRLGRRKSFKELGDMLGPLVIGAVTQAWGVRVGFVVCGVAAFVGAVLLAIRRPRTAA